MRNGTALLDVNVLVALFDPDHLHHELAHDWFEDHRSGGWATCPTTETGFLRVLGSPAYGGTVSRTADLLARLSRFCSSGDHVFWPDGVSLRDAALFTSARVTGFHQLTDIYLLGVAKTHAGRLVTFDRAMPWKSIVGATADLVDVIAPVEGE